MSSSTCELCQSSDLSKKDYPQAKPNKSLQLEAIYECKKCNYGWALPSYDQEQINQFYANGEYWEDSELHPAVLCHYKSQAEVRVKKALQHFDSSKKEKIDCLDIGAGQGFIGLWMKEQLKNKNVNYEFYELDEQAKKNIVANQPDRVAAFADFPELPDDKKYDVIFACHVVEHLASPIPFLEKIRKHLSPDGVAYIEVPCRDDEFKDSVFPHTLFFSQESLNLLADKVNLKPIESSCFGPAPKSGPPPFTEKLLSKFYYLSMKTSLWKLQRFLNHCLFSYSDKKKGIWVYNVLKA